MTAKEGDVVVMTGRCLQQVRLLALSLVLLFGSLLTFTACDAPWDDHARQAVFNECMKRKKEIPQNDRQRYCSCFMREVEKQFPTTPEILEADPALFNSLTYTCADTAKAFVQDWPDSVKDKFLKVCVEAAQWRNVKDPPAYCLCIMERTILSLGGNRYGDGLQYSSIHGAVAAIGNDCQKANIANVDSILKAVMPKPKAPEEPGTFDPIKEKNEVPFNPF